MNEELDLLERAYAIISNGDDADEHAEWLAEVRPLIGEPSPRGNRNLADTFRTMTVEHLGSEATVEDLAAFRRAGEALVFAGESPKAATDWLWNDGDFLPRVNGVIRRIERGEL